MKRSFFVPKSRKRYGWETPARRAIASVEVPWRPRSANSTNAASTISSRRSAALFRSPVVATGWKLALTHNSCQDARDPVELPVRQSRVERERERALVAGVGAGERARPAVRGKPVERVRPDLALDLRLPQRSDGLVSS